MNRTVLRLALTILAVASLSAPCQACWWDDYDDWYDWFDDYDYGYDYDYDYYYDDYDYNDYSNDYNYGNDSYDFENYDVIYDYENYEDTYDDIYIDNSSDEIYALDLWLDDVVITPRDNFWFQEDNSWWDDGADPDDYNDPPSNEIEPIDPPGTNEDGGGGGNDGGKNLGSSSNSRASADVSSNDPVVGWYPPSNMDKWQLYNIKELKFLPNIHLVTNLPDKFLGQKLSNECVANSIAIAAGIIDGTDPEITREAIRDIAKKAKYDLVNEGIPLGEIRNLLKDYCAISDDNKFNRDIVENNIDNNNPVMVVTEVFDEKEKSLGVHMVTITGYDAMYYYCAFGKEEAAAVPKTELEIKNVTDNAMKYRLYFYNGKKGVYR